MGCSLKGSTASTIAYWDHFHTYIINDFSQLSQIWGYVWGGNGVSVGVYIFMVWPWTDHILARHLLLKVEADLS